jgi:MYXO-CTERM domain-containing protein
MNRRLPLAALVAAMLVAGARPALADVVVRPPPSPSSDPPQKPSDPPPVEPKRGCGCEVAGEDGGALGTIGGTAGAFAIAALLRARRRRPA